MALFKFGANINDIGEYSIVSRKLLRFTMPSSRLLKKAGKQLAVEAKNPLIAPDCSTDKLWHELQVHQVELEMQNETLRDIQTLLELSRDKYLELFDFAPVGYLSLSRENLITEINLAAAAMLGIERERLILHNFNQWIANQSRDAWHRHFLQLTQNGGKQTCEIVMRRDDGSSFDALVDCCLVTHLEQPPSVRVVLTDITERKRAALAVKDSEQRMLLATETTGVGVWEWDIVAGKVRWDAQMFRIYGLPPTVDGLIPYAIWSNSVLAEDLSLQEQVLQDTIRRVGHSNREFRIRRADNGECRHIHAVETVRANAQGQVEWVVGTNLDVTERVLAETALRESEARWRFALSVTNLGAWELNLADYTAWRSLRHDQIFGYEELLPEWTYEIFLQHVLEEERAELDRCFRQAMAEHKGWCAEFRIRRADGQVRWLWVKTKGQDQEGGLARMFGLVSDITDRKRAEQELLDAAKRTDEFLAMLAHELRNPLAPIRNAVEILKYPDSDPSRIAWCSDVIDRQLKHMNRLVDDLLDVSRITRGLVELKKEILDIEDFIRPALETNQPLIDARGQDFSITLPPESLWVEGDRVRLTQVLSNLINNAAKYTPVGGRIELSAAPAGNEVCIRVYDNGCGIEATALPKLFDLFYQEDCSLDRSQGGLGIGLSLVSRLVEMHGGEVRAFSAGRGQGSEFTVRLPRLIFPKPEAASGLALIAPALGNLRILVVDDNRDGAESMAMLLESDGHLVHTCYDARSALEMARTEQLDTILLDIGLPGMDGYMLAQELRRSSELKLILLVAMTGHGQPEDEEKSRAAGFDAHLVKPVDFDTLRKLLAKFAMARQQRRA